MSRWLKACSMYEAQSSALLFRSIKITFKMPGGSKLAPSSAFVPSFHVCSRDWPILMTSFRQPHRRQRPYQFGNPKHAKEKNTDLLGNNVPIGFPKDGKIPYPGHCCCRAISEHRHQGDNHRRRESSLHCKLQVASCISDRKNEFVRN